MAATNGTWIRGVGWGCGGLVLCAVLAVVWMTVSVRGVFEDAHGRRDILDAQFADAGVYTPAVNGAVPSDRVEVFLTVRDSLAPARRPFESLDGEAAAFEALAENGEAPMRQTLPSVFRLTGAMIRMPWLLAELELSRNQALIDGGMGLAEYTYIYSIAYQHDRLSIGPESTLFDADASNARIRRELRGMLARQLERARSAVPADDPWLTRLEEEVERLEADAGRVPWQDGLPEAIAESLAPFRSRLDATYSGAAAEFELLNSSVRAGGLQISME